MFQNEDDRKVHTRYYIPKVKIKDYNVMIDKKNYFEQSVKSNMRTSDNIRKIKRGQRDDYTTGCLLDYNYFKKHYTKMTIDLNKQQALDADTKAIKQINFTGNLDRDGNTTMFFIIEETKKTILEFS